MQNFINSMPIEDRLPIVLSMLYEQSGYKKYCMSKFEEYGFYSDNRDFLSTDGIIAFNNSAGKLMALKPDITLSIVKNARRLESGYAKYYYNENVYRIDGSSHDCKEIKQCGIEVLGDLDEKLTAEAVTLAVESLKSIDKDFSLIISHISFVNALLIKTGIKGEDLKNAIRFIKGKNSHDLLYLCEKSGVSPDNTKALLKLLKISGELLNTLAPLKELVFDEATKKAYLELEALAAAFKGSSDADKIKLDLSVINNLDYYNGIVLQGYVRNAPAPVLSGGRYDSLAAKIRGEGGAFGFALYLDGLNLYYPKKVEKEGEI